jgi:hypothetical protein
LEFKPLKRYPIPLYPPSPGRGRGKKKKEGLAPLLDTPFSEVGWEAME